MKSVEEIEKEQGKKVAKMHTYLNGSGMYNQHIPFLIEDLFTDEEDEKIKSLINYNINNYQPLVQGGNEKLNDTTDPSKYKPKYVKPMSRLLVEFDLPEESKEKLDNIAKPLYKERVELAHYTFIDYDRKFSDNKFDPILPPHLDGDENLVTINYCLDGNIDWDLYIGDIDDPHSYSRYELKKGQAIVFSAINQIHWRPRKKFKEGDFLQIITFDYCAMNHYLFTGELNPIDPVLFQENRKKQILEMSESLEFQTAWNIYNKETAEAGIVEEDRGF